MELQLMMGHNNKHINALSNRDLFAIEKKEHNLTRTPSVGQLLRLEMVEHNLKNKPSLTQVKKAEAKEAKRPDLDFTQGANLGIGDGMVKLKWKNFKMAQKQLPNR
jgi:hypothetical protein